MATHEKKRLFSKVDYDLFTDNVVKESKSTIYNINYNEIVINDEEKKLYTEENADKYGFYIGKIQSSNIDAFMEEHTDSLHSMMLNSEMRESIFNASALECRTSRNRDLGRYQIPVTRMKHKQEYKAVTGGLSKLSKIVQDKAMEDLKIISKEENSPFNLLITINQKLKDKARIMTGKSFHRYVECVNERTPNTSDLEQLVVPRQNIHVDLPYDTNYKNKYLAVLPLLNCGAKVRVVTSSHQYDSWRDCLSKLVSGRVAHKPQTIVVPLNYGEFICFHPKLVHSGWEANFNLRLHTYIGFTNRKITDNKTYFIPRLVYPYFCN